MEEPKFPYRRVLDDLRSQIQSGRLSGQIPTRLALAADYGVSGMTIDRVIRELKKEDLIVTVPGLGMYVKRRLA
jgi:DNA-binding GntR family transcriptional regulator